MANIRLLFIAYNFPPVQHSGTIRNEALAHYFPENGIRPTILAAAHGHPDRSEGLDQRIDPMWEDDPRWGDVHRIHWPVRGASLVERVGRRIPVLASQIRLSRRERTVDAVHRYARDLVKRYSPEVIYVSYSPAEAVILGARLADEFSIPAILDYRDLWSYTPGGSYRHWADFLIERRYERRLLRSYDRIFTTTETAAQLLQQRLSVAPEKVQVVQNGYDERDFDFASSRSREPTIFLIVHAGQLALHLPGRGWKRALKQFLGLDYSPLHQDSRARSPVYFLRAVENVLDERPEMLETLRIRLVGLDPAAFAQRTSWFRYPEVVEVIPRVSRVAAARMVQESDLLLLLQNYYRLDKQDLCVAIPAKLYTYLRSKGRILACVQPSEISDIVRRHDAGEIVSPYDVEGMSEAIINEYKMWQTSEAGSADSANANTLEGYSRRTMTARAAAVVKELSGHPRNPGE